MTVNANKHCGYYSDDCDSNYTSFNLMLYSNAKGELTHLNGTLGFYGGAFCYPSDKAFNIRINVPFTSCTYDGYTGIETCKIDDKPSALFQMIDSETAKNNLLMVCNPPIKNGQTIDALRSNYSCPLFGFIDVVLLLKLTLGNGTDSPYLKMRFNETHGAILTNEGEIAVPKTAESGCYEEPSDYLRLPLWAIIVLGIICVVVIIAVICMFVILVTDNMRRNKGTKDQKNNLIAPTV
ncbi:hypothetical protein WA158_005083 [Blastocystis sp. Blastoise]